MQKMSGSDLSFAAAEMMRLLGKRIAKIRRTEKGIFLLKIGTEELLFEPAVRLHITRQAFAAKDAPDGFTSLMRKVFEGKTIEKIEQVENERIVEMTVRSKERLVFELFRKGNVILVSEEGSIIACLNKDESGGRRVARGEKYAHPKASDFQIKKPKIVRFSVKEKDGAAVSYSSDGASFEGREFSSFCEAADFYYANQLEESEGEKAAAAQIKMLLERKKSQEETLARMEAERRAVKEAGDEIYRNYEQLAELLKIVQRMKKEKKSDEEISRELEKHKAKLSGQNVEVEV